VKPFENAVPVYDLKAAAGGFSEEQQADSGSLEWAELPDYYRPRPGMFVARVVGESMNRVVPDGAWALFRLHPQGSRERKVVLVQHREIQDTDTGGHYTLKRYYSDKERAPDGTWRHARVILRPESDREGYQPIVIDGADESELQIIAELIGVISG
jgi:uncharacterized protein